MSFFHPVFVALGAIRSHALRSILTILGVVVGVAAVVCMTSIGEGAQAEVQAQIRKLGSRLLMIVPGAATTGIARLGIGTRHTLTEVDLAALRQLPTVDIVAPLTYRRVQVIAGNKNWSTNVLGNNGDYLIAREWPLTAGRLFSEDEIAAGAKVALIGRLVSERLFAGSAQVGDLFRIEQIPFVIAGILDSRGKLEVGGQQSQDDDTVIIPLTTARIRMGGQQFPRLALNYILVKGAADVSMSMLKASVQEALMKGRSKRRDAAKQFEIQDPADTLAAQEATTKTSTLLLASIAAVSLAVGAISIMNIMLVSVTERTREIGLRVAVGARRRDVGAQFLVEAVTLAVVGGLIGIAAGSTIAAGIAYFASWPILVSPSNALLSFGCACLTGVISGVYPAYRAAKLDPIVALRFE